MDDMVAQYAFKLLSISPSLLLVYLSHRKKEDQCLRVWQALLSDISRHPDVVEASIRPLLDAAQHGSLPLYLKPSTGEVDVLVENLISRILAGESTHAAFVRQALQSPGIYSLLPFLPRFSLASSKATFYLRTAITSHWRGLSPDLLFKLISPSAILRYRYSHSNHPWI
jgi:hypothetical protein